MNDPKLKEKAWSKELEKPIYQEWKETNRYAFDKKSKKQVYSIDTPPPYVNSPVHMGHATTYTLMDMFARYRRMAGCNVLFPLGLDRNGLPIEMAAEKKFKIRFGHVPREEYLDYCNKVLEEASAESVDTFLRLGHSYNSWKIGTGLGEIYETDSADYRALTQDTFIDLWNKGFIYEAERTNNYCPGCRTTIADSEIDYTDVQTIFSDIKFTVAETGEEIIIGTTRPEFVCSCAMIIYHPDDQRYKHLEGKHALTPIFQAKVPIKAHPYAQMDKGTGLVMMCSFGDYTDIRFFREMNLAPLISINADGTMNERAGFLCGMRVKDARKKMLDTLKEKNLMVNQRTVSHRTPICERSKDHIEFIAMKEFYLKQVDFKDKMREVADKISFYSPRSKQILLDWIDAVSIDWPISRRRFYATEIPLWYCTKCSKTFVPPKGHYYQPWKEKPPIDKCTCGNREFRGEERVFDTWFDSSISPLYILQWSRDETFFERAKPCTLRPQGKEIVRTWLYYTLLKDYLLTGDVIFHDVWIHHHILDEKGKKMSKSMGNAIDPKELLDKYGAEPIRLWVAVEGNIDKDDFVCSYERIEGAGKTLTKLWNVARFISMFPECTGKVELLETDKWIVNEVHRLIHVAAEGYPAYDFHNPILEIKHFLWETFASHYLEMVKSRAYNESNTFTKEQQNGALQTLHYCLDVLLQLLAPVIPMITY
ncbi:valine--tRNA ligase, partial [Candidatus Woesearchaeota archaeon]|nr:valine--tRNA ligase [Candidatus Woesearchaeota archaeon]